MTYKRVNTHGTLQIYGKKYTRCIIGAVLLKPTDDLWVVEFSVCKPNAYYVYRTIEPMTLDSARYIKAQLESLNYTPHQTLAMRANLISSYNLPASKHK